jgi:glycosyltransferase involved in cell wall biosynthesis
MIPPPTQRPDSVGRVAEADGRATVCVPAYNESRNIGGLLDSLHDECNRGTPLGPILVEASGSSDRTGDVVREHTAGWPQVRLIEKPERLGLARALSEMLQEVDTPIVVRVDADVRLPPGVLGRLLPHLREPGAGIVGPRIMPGASGRRLLDAITHAEYFIHDRVSRVLPKITNVQIFWKFDAPLPHDVETEDIMLQSLATEGGRRPVYVPGETVYIEPPSSIRAYVRQRVRVVSSERWYHARTGRDLPSTADPKIVVPAMFEAAGKDPMSGRGLVLFLLIEAAARLYVRARYAVVGHVGLDTWQSVR